MKGTVPQLSKVGWIQDDLTGASVLLAQCFESNFSQSHVYKGSVTSLSYNLHIGSGSVDETVTSLQKSLYRYFDNYFTDVEVDVSEPDGDLSGKASIDLYVGFSDNKGVKYTLRDVLQIEGGVLTGVLNYSNYGI